MWSKNYFFFPFTLFSLPWPHQIITVTISRTSSGNVQDIEIHFFKIHLELEFWPRWRRWQKPFASSHNQKEDNNWSKINKQPEVPEIKLHGTPTTKELKKKSIRTTRSVRQWPGWGGQQRKIAASPQTLGVGPAVGRRGLHHQGWLKGKLDSELIWRLLQWEKLPVSHKTPLESVLGTSRQAALFPLWRLPHRQHCSLAKRVALPGGGRRVPKAPPLSTYQLHQDKYGPNERTEHNLRNRAKRWGHRQPIWWRI